MAGRRGTQSARRGARRPGLLLTGILGLAVLVGCTSPADPPTPTPSPSPSEPVALTVAVYGHKAQVEAFDQVASAFEAEDGGVEVKVSSYPDATTAEQALEEAVAAGDSVPDVFLADQRYVPRLALRSLVTPLDVLLEERGVQFGDDHQRVALTSMSAASALQCMPVEMSPLVVYYNKRLVPRKALAALGIQLPQGTGSWSWSDFVTTARAVADRDGPGPIRGVYLPAGLDLVTAMVRSAGEDIVDDVVDPTVLDLTSETGLATLTAMATLMSDGRVAVTPAEAAEQSPTKRFVDGTLGLYVATRAELPRLRAEKGLRFDVVELPSFGRTRGVSSVSGFCVSATSEHVEEAADFIAYAVSRDGVVISASSGGLVPARLDVLNSPVFAQPGAAPKNATVFADMARRSEPLPTAVAWPEVRARANTVLGSVLTDPPADLLAVLTRLRDRANGLLTEPPIPSPTPSPTE